MLGKWKPVEITNEINFELYEIPAEDMVNLPVKNSENDYLEFIHTDGNDIIIPHLTGSLKNFFCNPSGHKVTFDHIEKGLLDWEKMKNMMLHIILFPEQTNFSHLKSLNQPM